MSDRDSSLPKALPPVAQTWGCTDMKVDKFSFEWTITNFSVRPEKMGEVLLSPTFPDVDEDQIKWCLVLYPKGVNEESKDYLSLFLKLISCNKSEVQAKFELCILNANSEKTTNAIEATYKPFGQSSNLGYRQFIKRDILSDQVYCLLPEDMLTIYCEISVLADSVNISGQSKKVQFKVPKCKLSEYFGNLIDNKKFSDVTLSVGGREFQAHKAILAARSDVFAAMFEHEMEERKLNRVDITDVDPEVFMEMLRFIYTDKAPNLKSMANELLAAADKYALEKLKVMCEKALYINLSVETAAETLKLADLHNANQLKAQIINFINAHANDVMETSGWKNITTTHLHLILDIYCALATQQMPPTGPLVK